MASSTLPSEDYARMVNSIIRMIKHSADGTDLRPQGVAHHFLEPVRCNDFQVVSKQGDHFAVRVSCAQVLQPSLIVSPCLIHEGHSPFLGQATEKVECLPVLCRMCDNDEFKAGIGGFLIKAPDTAPQGIALTVTHDDERNERRRLR